MSHKNDNRCVIHLIVFTFVLLLMVSFSARSTEQVGLIDADKISVKTWLSDPSYQQEDEKERRYAVNEQIILYIEVVTPRWFTGGTRLSHIEIPNVVTKQRGQLATNFTEKKNGITWTHQRWEITLYPQEKGDFIVPSTAVNVHISREGGGNVSGVLYTEPQRFTAVVPSGLLSDESQWVSGRDIQVEQTWESSNDELKAGDSIMRTLTISGQDTLAMLIPQVITPISTEEYQVYAQPNQLADSQTRGNYLSERKESSVYVLQTGGDIRFPSLEFTWWDVDEQTLKTIEVAGKSFVVQHTFQSWLDRYWHALTISIAILFLFVAVISKTIRYYRHHPLPTWWVYSQAVKKKEWGKVRVLIYRLVRSQHQQMELKQINHSGDWQKNATEFQTNKINASLSRKAWKQVAHHNGIVSLIMSKCRSQRVFPQLNKQRKRYSRYDE